MPTQNTAGRIVRTAASIIEGDRATQHGPKERNHQNIADHWNAYLGARLTTPITALDVALMMVELKIARTKAGEGRLNRDNYVDMAGYAGTAGEIALMGKEDREPEGFPVPAHHIPLQEPGSFMIGPGNQGLAEFDPT